MSPQEIVQLRIDSGLSRENFARLFSVSPATISYWESGQRNPAPIYETHLIALRRRIDAFRRDNANNEIDIGRYLLNFLLVGGLFAFFTWVFTRDD